MLDGLSHDVFRSNGWDDAARKVADDLLTNMLIERIEQELALFLKTDKVYYSYFACKQRLRGDGECRDADHRTVWVGPGLKRFVATLMKRAPVPFALYATSARTKGKQVDGCPDDCPRWEPPYAECTEHVSNTYWIGDAGSNGQMICCDDLWWMMWNRLLDRKGLNQGEDQSST